MPARATSGSLPHGLRLLLAAAVGLGAAACSGSWGPWFTGGKPATGGGLAAEPRDPARQPATRPTRYGDVGSDELDAALALVGEHLAAEHDFLPAYIDLPPAVEAVTAVAAVTAPAPVTVDDDLLGHAELLRTFNRQHPMVQQWIDYFTGRGREQYARFYQRLQLYGDRLQDWLVDEGVPPELIWLSFIESGVNPRAYSRAHAAGMWQFISSTGRMYGLTRDFWLDERRDPERSTRAAARHLVDLYEKYESWELAFSAYNAGARRVAQAIEAAGHRDYWRMVHQRYVLPRETRHYVPKLVAAHRIGRNLAEYGFGELTGPAAPAPVSWASVAVPNSVSLDAVAGKLGVPAEDLKLFNLHLRRSITPPRGEAFVNVPYALAATLTAKVEAGAFPRESWGHVHVVRSGDTLWDIARAYDTSVGDLVALNSMHTRRIYPGQRLVVPGPGSPTRSRTATVNSDGTVTVYRGDSLSRIAARLGTSVAALMQANDLRGDTIHPGQKLKVPGSAAPAQEGDVQYVRYRVRYGDTLWTIARRYRTTVNAIRQANSKWDNVIKVGEILLIPQSLG